MAGCPIPDDLVEREIDRVLTQYRESPKLLHLIRTYLRQAEAVLLAICDMPAYFDLDTAVGDQLTLVGKRMGWPRCHCVCSTQPVFGFDCTGVPNGYVIAGLCDENATWVDCDPSGTADVCITDDEVYRSFLRARRYQMLALYDVESLTAAIRHLWGDMAMVMDAGVGEVVVAPGRVLTIAEQAILQLYPRVMPIAPGIRVRIHFGAIGVFGFGSGWGEFCEPWEPVGLVLETEVGEEITDENDDPIMTGPLTQNAEWMCPVDVRPYGCPL